MKHLFSVLLLHLLLLSNVYAAGGNFPFEGGTTSDSIVITAVQLEKLQRTDGNNIQVVEGGRSAVLSFHVTVPDGKTAQLSFGLMLDVEGDDDEIDRSTITFKARIDDEPVKDYQGHDRISQASVLLPIPAGSHTVSLHVSFDVPGGCIVTGNLNNLSVHVHRFGNAQLKREPVCGAAGEIRDTCSICKRCSTFVISPKYKEHSLKVLPAKQGSCLDNTGDVKACEHCPYTEIAHVQLLKGHDFDADGTCKVCGLHKPKCNADSTVYEIYDAGEMRILAEMVATGKISGNLGVDIKADLVFDTVPMLPLGTFTNPFRGVLNGNGHRISGVTHGYQGFDGLGFVGVARGSVLQRAVIANLIVDGGCSIKGAAFVGGIVGYASFCEIYHCASFATLDGTDYVGGIVGFADQQVGIVNCGAATAIRTAGKWNPMACNMTSGHVQNSYGASTISRGGTLDELTTPDVRHCFSSHGSGKGITRITPAMLSSYDMRQWLAEESESLCFTMSEHDAYPVPVVCTTIVAKSNGPVTTADNIPSRRAATADDYDTGKGEETEVLSGYVDDNASLQLGTTIREVMSADSTDCPNAQSLYIVTRRVPEGFHLYDRISGGQLLNFESCITPPDSSYFRLRDYEIVAPGKVKAFSETVNHVAGASERIDEYRISDGDYTLVSRTTFENQYNIIYQENIGGRLRTVWTIKTTCDDEGRPVTTRGFSHNYVTGEVRLNYSFTYKTAGHDEADDSYSEYYDSATNSIHVFYNYLDSVTGQVAYRDHYIVSALDKFVQELRTEQMVDGQPCLVDGVYFLYDDEGHLSQTVVFGPTEKNNPDSAVSLYIYDEYIGARHGHSFPTAIKVPALKQAPLQKRMDSNVYDAQGRALRRVTGANSPFSGLPRGLYIYQGSKYLVRR